MRPLTTLVTTGDYVVRVVVIPVSPGRESAALPFGGIERGDEILAVDGRAVTSFRAGESLGISRATRLLLRRRKPDGASRIIDLNVAAQ